MPHAAKEDRAAYARRYYHERRQRDPAFAEVRREQSNARNQSLRREVIALYGGACECCGVSDWQFLTLEHKQGGGYVHRKERGVRGAYYDARRTFDPEKYGVLCWNCNSAKGLFGECPHAL